MGFLDRAAGELRSLTTTLAEPDSWLVQALSGGASFSGKTVTPESSLSLIPVFSAVSLIAGACGSLPLNVYRQTDQGDELATNHRLWPVLHDQPNPEMAADEVWENVFASLLLWGNAFLAKPRGPDGLVNRLWPIPPDRVQVGRKDGLRYFVVTVPNGPIQTYFEDDILHVRGLGKDGLVGYSPIQLARQQLGTALAMDEFSGRLWANSARPGGLLKHPNKLTKEAAERVSRQWESAHGGLSKSGRTAVLEEGMEWQTVGLPPEDAQLVEQLKLSDLRVAQLYRLPPRMIGASSGDSMTYKTTESESLDFVKWTLRRWLVRGEGSLLRDPDLFLQGRRFYPRFDVDELLRGDMLVRYSAHAIGINAGFETQDEARQSEGRMAKGGKADELPDPGQIPLPTGIQKPGKA